MGETAEAQEPENPFGLTARLIFERTERRYVHVSDMHKLLTQQVERAEALRGPLAEVRQLLTQAREHDPLSPLIEALDRLTGMVERLAEPLADPARFVEPKDEEYEGED